MAVEHPVAQVAAHLRQLPREEMVHVRDNDEPRRLGQRRDELANAVDVAELVFRAVEKQFRFATLAKEREIVAIEGRAEADEFADAIIVAADCQADDGAETEPGKHDGFRREFGGKPVERGADIVFFASALVVNALAHPRSAEIEPKHGQTEVVQRARHLKNDFVVHGAAEQRMGMASEGDHRRVGSGDGPEHRFQATGRSVEEHAMMKNRRHWRSIC